jgi:uncharacterized membrane protein YgcG
MKRLILLSVAAAAFLAPSAALASGVVLKVQPARHLVAVARTPTRVALVHTTARLHVGQRVALTARKLRNGTLAASRVRVVGRARTVKFRGLVLARTTSRLVLSANGAVIAVHRGSRSTSSARDDEPRVGSTVDVTARIDEDGDLDEDDAALFSPPAPGGQIEGRLTIGTGTIAVTSEHLSLVLKEPAGLVLLGFATGDEVLATFSQGTDGSLTLTALSRDDNAQRADDDNGDDRGGDGRDGHDGGDGGGGGGDDGGGHH